ncbi:hypothetical protein F0562_035486 [Nyssa sinensis]|uniref:NAB domain-containing protein n=1 Tax=Nyssa sinensis TaxID=561372 RepID=A0A5J5ABG6_9ASTE|nr:hypothetical protein F0562_035486 [Nyssa sinensis]
MTKNRWREPFKSFASHIAPEKDQELQGTKIEIDEKVTKIMKLIKNKNKNKNKKEGSSRKETQLLEFVEDFHQQYQSLFALYDDLRGEVRDKVHDREKKEGSSSSTSSSDSESYYSPDEIGGKTSPSSKVKDNFRQKLENSNLEVAELKNKLTSMSEEKEALNLEYVASLNKIQESEKIIEGLRIEAEQTESIKQNLLDESSQLKEKLVEKEKELLSLTERPQFHESEASARIKELESQVTSKKLEMETLRTQKRELEEKIELKATEAKQVGEESLGLQARILELEMASKEKGDELSATLKKFEENENNLMSKTEELAGKANDRKLGVDALQTQKNELEGCVVCKSNEASARVKDLMEQLDVLHQELESQLGQKTESESQLEKQNQEISAFLVQIQNLTEKLTSTTLNEQRMLEEKEGLRVRVKDLELKVDSLCSQKTELEEQIRRENHEANQLRVEKEGLNARILVMEKSQAERGNELSAFQTKLEYFNNDASTQIKTLRAQINSLQREMDSLQTEKSQLELQKERENIKLTSKISDQERTLKGQDDVINKLNEESKQAKVRLLESKLNLQNAERKSEEMAEELRKKFEDGLRLLSRRIRVAEQLHVENKDFYMKTKEKYEQEHIELKERIATDQVAVRRIKDITVIANDMLTELDPVALKFQECSGHFLNRISKVSCELKFAKDWVSRKNNAIKHVKEDIDCLLAQLDVKEAEILGFRERVWKLENKVRELEKIVKEKEEGMLVLGEEKREAIRQLCVWIDYHRSRSDYLKKMLSEMTVRSQGTP